MVADASVRCRGLASQALAGLLEFAGRHVPVNIASVVAMVQLDNRASLRLFRDRFGFVERARSSVFNQVSAQALC